MGRSRLKSSNEPSQSVASRILDEAAELFATQGYAATTTRELAERVDLERASLYYYIKSKEELLHRICVDTMKDAERVMDRAMAEPDESLRLRTLIVDHTVTILRNRNYNVTMLLELRALTGEARDEVIAMRDAYDGRVRDLVRDGQRAGVVRDDLTAKMLTISMLNLLNWTLVWYGTEDDLSPRELGEHFATIFLEGVLAVKPSPA